MKTKKNGVKRKSRLIGKLKGKKRSKIMRGGSGESRAGNPNWRSSRSSLNWRISPSKLSIQKSKNKTLEIYEFTNTGIGILYNQPSKEFYDSPISYYYISLFELNVDTMQYALNNNCVNQYKKFPLIRFRNFPSLVVSTSMGWSTKSRNVAYFFDVVEDGSNMIPYEEQKQMFLKDIDDVKENKDEYNYYNLYPYLSNVKLIKADNSIVDIQLGERIQYAKENAIWLENYFEQNKLKEIKEIPVYSREKYSDLHGLDLKYIIIDEMIINIGDIEENYVILGYPDYKTMKPMILEFLQKELQEEFKIIHKKQNDEFYTIFSELFNLYVNDANKQINLDPVNLKNELYKIFYNDMIGNWDYISNIYIEKGINFDKSLFLKNYNTYFNIIAKKYLNCIISSIKYTFLIYKKLNIEKNEYKLVPFVFNIKELEPKHKPILERVKKIIQNEIPNIYKIKEVDDYNKIETYDNSEIYDKDKEYKLFYSYHTHGEFFHITTEYLHTMLNLGNMAHTYKNRITLEEIIYSSGLLSYDNLTPFWKKLVLKYQVREWNIYYSDFDKNNTRNRQKTLVTTENNTRKKTINTSRSFEAFKQYEESKQIRKDKLTSSLVSKIETSYKNNNLSLQKTEAKTILDLTKTFLNNEAKAQIILMERNSSKHYIFYYKVNNKFYKITLQLNLKNISETDINYIFTNIKNNNKIIRFTDDNNLNIFKVYENIELNSDSLKPIFKYNPLVYYVNNARYSIDDDNIDTSLYYANEMLDIKPLISKNIIIPQQYENLYKTTKPWFYRNFLQDKFYLKSKMSNNSTNYFNNSIWNTKNNKKCHKQIYYEEKFKGCDKKNCGDDSHINCVYYNINNSGYDIIEIIDNSAEKIIIWIVPSNKDNKDTPYLGNILDLNGEHHILLLEGIKKLYENKNMLCFLHNTVNHQYFCLHFHITQNNNYKRKFPKFEFGTYISQDLYITDIIEKLRSNKNYFTNYNNIALVRQQ